MTMTWRQMRILIGKARQTCYCTDQVKYTRCKTCPWFEVGVEINERWRETSDLAKHLLAEADSGDLPEASQAIHDRWPQ